MKRVVSLFLTLAMLIGMLPMKAFAAETQTTESTGEGHTHDYLAVVTLPTSTEQGCTDYTCSVCGDSYRTPWLDETAYEGKTIACIGDSITAAYGVTKDETDYVTLLAEQLGMDYIRLGVSGTTLCTDGSRTCNIGKLTEASLNGADVVTIAMGINDFCAAGAGYYELGDIESTDTSTIYGAVRMWCERIAELRKTESLSDTQFYFITPVICSWNNSVTTTRDWDQSKTNIHGYTLRDLCNAIMEVAALYDVAVIDLNLLSGMYYVDAEDNNTAEFGGDGVHPGEKGHEMMASALANVLLQNNLRDDHAHTFGSWITTTWPSCVAGEQQRVCTVCSAAESRTLEPNGSHSYHAVITAPTYTQQGYTTYTCDLCGDSYVSDYTDPISLSSYRWEMQDNAMVSVTTGGNTANALTLDSGSITDGTLTSVRYTLQSQVRLYHNLPWVIEWRSSGNWDGMLLGSTMDSSVQGLTYLFRYAPMDLLAFGEYTGTWNNYGVIHSIDMTVSHVFRLENRIAADGSNAVYLLVDGQEIDVMQHYYVGGTNKNQTVNWANGRDIVFANIGTTSHPVKGMKLDYLQVWEKGEPAEPMSLRYDDHVDMTGKTVEILDAGESAVVSIEGNYLVATGIGTAIVRIDGQLCRVTVEKAKVNLIMIMGQSNAGNHFANAISDVTCSVGTAYWWGNGLGTAATAPVPYTQPSLGFHTPLLAELYAQSAAAGDPVKNVLIWEEGITSKNGQSIVKWAASAEDTSGTDDAVAMLTNCRAYYEAHSDKYEIVGSGVYWLQGESDTGMDPTLYTQRFMAMWQRLKNAGMEYVAFFRVRRASSVNPENRDDLYYSASLSAQIKMINENPEFYMATTVTENWVGTPATTHTVDISNYITMMETYGRSGSYTDQYGNDATYADGKLTTTMKSLYGSNNTCHYGKFGYGVIGADAAYNMYNALHRQDAAIVVTDTSGHADRQQVLLSGQEVTVDTAAMTDNLSFRVAPGSTAGTLNLVIRSGKTDITSQEGLIIPSGEQYGTVNVRKLWDYEDVSIEITYTTTEGTVHTAVCRILTPPREPKKDYIWDFNEDLYARSADGEIQNSLLGTALVGSYTLENGYLNAKSLQMQLENIIELEADKNWSVEWKYGSLNGGTAGFLLCSDKGNTIGNKAIWHVNRGYLTIADYKDSEGYRNYTFTGVTIRDYDCLRLTNRYDPNSGKCTISLWINDELVVEDFQLKGSINNYHDQTDMTKYPLVADFTFGYLGNRGMADWYVSCQLDYLKISFGEEDQSASYAGKVISVLGDSISTFAGYIPVADGFNMEHLARYPQDNLLTDVNETWWMQVIDSLDAKLGINDSWRGATCSGAAPVTTGTTGENASMANLTRIQNLGSNGTPDVILFYGGTNDLAHVSKVGSFDPDTAPTSVDLVTKKWDNLADGYVNTILRLQYYYPDAQIVCLLPTYTTSYYTDEKLAQGNEVLAAICEHYGVPYTDLRECGITTADLPDGIHPDAAGMDYITAAVVSVLTEQCNVEPGEHIVHSVTHELTGVTSSMGHYKGLSHGKPFNATLDGEIETVRVTMGGVDITESCYAGGAITIAEVTGALVIQAEGEQKAIYEDYLQQLPEQFCSATNLWTLLEHSQEYYTVNGWGVHSSGNVRSVTIPIAPGDRIWATSFQAAGANGSTMNGIRLTWFGETDVLESVGADKVYQEFAANSCLTVPEGAVAVNVVMWTADDSNELYILNREHIYENDICTCCGGVDPDAVESMALRYDDHVDMTGKTVEILDAGTPTSYQVGYGVEENAVLDSAVVALEGDTLVATGIGTAKVRIDGTLYEVTVEAAPISLLLLIGQSNMRGSEGNADQSIVCPDGMVYSTFGDDRGDTEGIMNVNNATKFAASALTGEYSTINVEGTTEHLSYYPLNSLTEAGAGKFGPDSGFAYEWIKQTGEKVWLVNAAHGGSAIASWQPNATNFNEAVLLFQACQETLRKEIAAGHFTLSHMGYFWCQGCNDASMTAEQYVTKYLAMHDGLKSALTFDHDSSEATDSITFEFAGMIPILYGVDSYRAGEYQDTNTYPYYQSFEQLTFNGPRVAQYWLCNNPELEDIWMVCNIGEDWVWMPDDTNGVTDYFQAHYENGTVDYTTQVAQSASWYTPTTPAAVHDSIHYNQIGYNEIGRESVRNALIMLGELEAPEAETRVQFLSWDGYNAPGTVQAAAEGSSGTLVVPKVYPLWKTKEVSYTLSEGLVWNYYDLLAEDDSLDGTLSDDLGMGTVTVMGHSWSEWETITEPSAEGPGEEKRTCADCGRTETRNVDGVWQKYALTDHLQELPEHVCCNTNIWTLLSHEDVHFTSGLRWGKVSVPAPSVTILLNPGDRIYATSFMAAGDNGGPQNGIRLTFFNKEGVAWSVGPGTAYNEWKKNGYIEAPEGTIAVNLPMWYDSEDYEFYILNRDHIYENGICLGCGAAQPVDISALMEALEVYDQTDAAQYTAESFAAYTEAVTAAKNLLEGGAYTQAEVDAALAAMNAAREALAEAGVECILAGSAQSSRVSVNKVATFTISTEKSVVTTGVRVFDETCREITATRTALNTCNSNRDIHTFIFKVTAADRGTHTYTVYAVLSDGSLSADSVQITIEVR